MHETSALWKQIFSEFNHVKEIAVAVNGVEYHEDRIIYPPPSVVGKLFDAPSVGNARARTLTLNLMPYDGPQGRIPAMSEIRLYVRLKSADGQRVSEWIPKGIFYADEVKRDSDTGATRISAFDAMMKMERQFGNAVVRVTFDDGFGGIQRYRREIGDAMPEPDTPTHEGERFLAWYPNPADTPTLARDMLFTAIWEEEPDISIIASGDWWTLYENGLLDVYCVGNMIYDDGTVNPPWYDYRNQITSVKLGNRVTNIGDNAFLNCTRLTNITVPDSVTSIGTGAFGYCGNLTSIAIPSSVTSIGDYAFHACNGMTSVTISNGVASIGEYAFNNCHSLTSVTIPGSVTSIGDNAFYACSGMTSVTIPGSVTSIGDSTFGHCSSLTNITIPQNVTSIGGYAFFECTSLTSITMPSSVTNIGVKAFDVVGYTWPPISNLTDVYYSGSQVQWDTITIEDGNRYLTSATIHYNSTGPS